MFARGLSVLSFLAAALAAPAMAGVVSGSAIVSNLTVTITDPTMRSAVNNEGYRLRFLRESVLPPYNTELFPTYEGAGPMEIHGGDDHASGAAGISENNTTGTALIVSGGSALYRINASMPNVWPDIGWVISLAPGA